MYLRFPKLRELLAQISGIFLETTEVQLHLQVVDAVHMSCIRRWGWHQSEGCRWCVSCNQRVGHAGQ